MTRRVLELQEYAARHWPRSELREEVGATIWRHFGKQVDVEFPSPRTGDVWKLTSKGWVGFIPLNDDLGLALRPKVPVRNLFRMLEVAYGLDTLRTFDTLYECDQIDDLYERVVLLLARLVLVRARRGLHRAYLNHHDRLPYLRGRLDVGRLLRAPWRAQLPCHFDEHTADVAENQLLLWALHVARRSGICSEATLAVVRRAHRLLRARVDLHPCDASEYLTRNYDRLTEDYRPLHALGWFVVEHAGPAHQCGDREMVPFLLDMNRLFERFVASWLRRHLPEGHHIRAQQRLQFGENGDVRFIVDLVLTDRLGAPRAVMDTKYKRSTSPRSADVAQVVAYSQALGVREAMLIYPTTAADWDGWVGDTHVRALGFDLGGDLGEAGAGVMKWLIGLGEA